MHGSTHARTHAGINPIMQPPRITSR